MIMIMMVGYGWVIMMMINNEDDGDDDDEYFGDYSFMPSILFIYLCIHLFMSFL